MRRGAEATAKAVAEQASGAEQVSKETGRLAKVIENVVRAMAEQGVAAGQITTAAESLRIQTEQAATATAEQAKAIKDVSTASENIVKQIKLISRANREHSSVSAAFLTSLKEIQHITGRNSVNAKDTLSRSENLRANSKTLITMVDDLAQNGAGSARQSRSGPAKKSSGATTRRRR